MNKSSSAVLTWLVILTTFIGSYAHADVLLDRVGPSDPDGAWEYSAGELAATPIRRADYMGTIINLPRAHRFTRMQFYFTLKSYSQDITGSEPDAIRRATSLALSMKKITISVFDNVPNTDNFKIIPSRTVVAALTKSSSQWRGVLFNGEPLFLGDVALKDFNLSLPAGKSVVAVSWSIPIKGIEYTSPYWNNEYYYTAPFVIGMVWSNYGIYTDRSARYLNIPNGLPPDWRERPNPYQHDMAVRIYGVPSDY